MNKIMFVYQADSIADIITNSSSMLFVRKADVAKEVLAEMINSVDIGNNVNPSEFEERVLKDERPSEIEYALEKYIEAGIIKLEDLSPRWYGISFDRDWVWEQNNYRRNDVRQKLENLGFEMIDGDY